MMCRLSMPCRNIIRRGKLNDKDFLSASWNLLRNSLVPEIQNPVERGIGLFGLSESWRKPLAMFTKAQQGITITRKTFQFQAERFAAQRDWRTKFPVGMTMRPIDAEILDHSSLHIVHLDPWSSPQTFLSKGAGACLLHQGQVVSESAAFFVGRGIAELGVHTTEPYRRQGLAPLNAAACIEMCLNNRIEHC